MEVRMLAWRIRSRAVAVGLAALSGACGTNAADAITPDANRTTDTFSGTVAVLGASTNPFSVLGNGNLDATITALGPQSTVSMGFGVGQPGATTCDLLTSTRAAQVGSVLSGTVAPGNYCVVLADIGNLTAPITYTITVVHP